MLVGRERELQAIEGTIAAATAGVVRSRTDLAREMAPALADGPPEPRAALAAE